EVPEADVVLRDRRVRLEDLTQGRLVVGGNGVHCEVIVVADVVLEMDVAPGKPVLVVAPRDVEGAPVFRRGMGRILGKGEGAGTRNHGRGHELEDRGLHLWVRWAKEGRERRNSWGRTRTADPGIMSAVL